MFRTTPSTLVCSDKLRSQRSASLKVLDSAATTRIAHSTFGRKANTSSQDSIGGRSKRMTSGFSFSLTCFRTFAVSTLCSSSAENSTGWLFAPMAILSP